MGFDFGQVHGNLEESGWNDNNFVSLKSLVESQDKVLVLPSKVIVKYPEKKIETYVSYLSSKFNQ